MSADPIIATKAWGNPIALAQTFDDNMPTGVAVGGGRVFVSFPCWGDPVSATLREVVDGKVVPYPNQAMTALDTARPGETMFSDKPWSSMRAAGYGCWIPA